MKWLEHKDKEKGKKILTEPSLDPILDEEIDEKAVFLDAPDVEEDSFKACVVHLLLNISAVYMEKRHFSDALKCLNEAEELAQGKLPDVLFRRSQVRTYNKYSTEEDLELAMQDLEKAFKSLEEYQERNKDNFLSKNNNHEIYSKHKEILKQTIEKKANEKYEKTLCLLNHAKESIKIMKAKNLKKEECFYLNGSDQARQYKILKE